MSTQDTRPTVEEVLDNATGYDETDALKHFDVNIETSDGIDRRPRGFLRALVFMHERRSGKKTDIALRYANNMTASDLADYFADDDEVTPDEPHTAAGKDDSGPESTPSN